MEHYHLLDNVLIYCDKKDLSDKKKHTIKSYLVEKYEHIRFVLSILNYVVLFTKKQDIVMAKEPNRRKLNKH